MVKIRRFEDSKITSLRHRCWEPIARVVSKYMHDLGKGHWQAVKWVLRYLLKTIDGGLVFKQDDACDQYATGFVDSDYAGDLDKRQSTTVYVFTLLGVPVSWKFTKHINVRYRFTLEIISEEQILFQNIEAIENPADLLTKVVIEIKFNHCLDLINITKF